MTVISIIPVYPVDLQCAIEKREFSIEQFLHAAVDPLPGCVEMNKFILKNRAEFLDRLRCNFRDKHLRISPNGSELWKSSINTILRGPQWTKGYLFPPQIPESTHE